MITVFALHRIKNDRVRAEIGKRYWTPEFRVEPGSAMPGRGGRRKRRRNNAAYKAQSVRNAMFPPLGPYLRNLQRWHRSGFDIYFFSCEWRGYRIRRREAKKRRRRERRDERRGGRPDGHQAG